MDTKIQNDVTNEKVSGKRRRLLKTAAAAAPVIATLQSGAAFANASAHLCTKKAEKDGPKNAVKKNNNDA